VDLSLGVNSVFFCCLNVNKNTLICMYETRALGFLLILGIAQFFFFFCNYLKHFCFEVANLVKNNWLLRWNYMIFFSLNSILYSKTYLFLYLMG